MTSVRLLAGWPPWRHVSRPRRPKRPKARRATTFPAPSVRSWSRCRPTGLQRCEPDADLRRQRAESVLNGRQTFGINAFAVYEYLAGLYTFEQPILGGRLQIGVAAPVVGYATMSASLQTQRSAPSPAPRRTPRSVTDADALLVELELRRLNVKITQMVVAPTGHYDSTTSSMSAATTGRSTPRSASPGSTRRRARSSPCCRASCSTR